MERSRSKTMKNILFFLAIAALLIIIVLAVIHTYVKNAYKNRIITPEQALELNADCILVLGARVWDSGPGAMLEDRLLQGIQLYKAGVSDRLLMSGDHGSEEYDEVNTMKNYAMERDVHLSIFLWIMPGFLHMKACIGQGTFFKSKK
jgi:SanA protein